ncbi:cytochrome c family protein [Rhizobium sp. SSA_523]|uniref:c-type cytochrome n=1 Tax=Rhizobium sp. SSA_523 TaxID=2952477 RepID=UPI002090192D|nr:cytochrome c family protein [Rhizobium sp. SSA_523]MCO5733991.1 cytochrome c family protein [Rhizobium sp. SSA_523]WKC24635.1 cytochrome c family protein [Rhizobium sp. SSA_523]
MPHQPSPLILPGLLLLILAMPLRAIAGDAGKGEASFKSACASCHAIVDEANIFGPHLKGVVGRRAASIAGYAYSDAMRRAGEQGLVWDEAALSAFLSSPQKQVPGTKMRFFGFWFQSSIDDVIAYLKRNP